MALFQNKEAEKNNSKPQTATNPETQPARPVTLMTPVTNDVQATPVPVRMTPVAAPSDARGAYLDSGSKISGKLYFESAARIDGQVEGEITAKEHLTVGESASVTAQIRASSVIVEGKVSGDITASQRIEIRRSAKVMGNITSPTVVIQEGSIFEGHCAMQEVTAAIAPREERGKVTAFPKEERLAQAAVKQA